ncbi:PLP-dependent aminotransferase family protein [Bradyrhizobium erythrophlei]|uniref:aminotransferase-like domain-containing protein n=1 Tax=Bradyrhizobium erythrophlei TaxID=1437360 RepID=UPI0035EE8344
MMRSMRHRNRPAAGTVRLSSRGRALARTPFPTVGRAGPVRAFRPCQPDLSIFPVDIWRRIAAKRSRLSHRNLLADADVCGFKPLRVVIAAHLRSTRGIACSAENVAVLGSFQQILDLSARLLIDPGDEVWMEDPGYPGARLVLEAAGAKVVGVPVDDAGLNVEAGRARAPTARLAYVTAGRQAPLGMPLALARRQALLEWANEADAIVIEDGYDREYRFEGRPLSALKSLDTSDRVLYTGTFSKLLFSSLRLAFVILPDTLVEPFTAAVSLTCRNVSLFPQVVLHDFMAEGHFGRHVRHMRMLYGERAKVLQEAAVTHLGGLIRIPPAVVGLDVPAFLPEGSDDSAVARLAADAGIETRPLSIYAVEAQAPAGLELGFAAVKPADIKAGVVTLARVLATAGKRSSAAAQRSRKLHSGRRRRRPAHGRSATRQ